MPQSLIPAFANSQVSISESLISIVLISVTVIVIGTFMGESIHTLAIVIEKTFDWIGRRYTNFRNLFYNYSSSSKSRIKNMGRELSEYEKNEMNLIQQLLHNWIHGSWNWLESRYDLAKYVLIGHRRVLELYLFDNVNTNESVEEMVSEMNVYKEHFVRKATFIYNIDVTDVSSYYPVLTTQLEEYELSRAMKFQSLYAFCRGMWVAAFLIGTAYVAVLFLPHNWTPSVMNYESIIQILPTQAILLLTILLAILMVLFMNSAGRYKLLYIQYLLSGSFTLDVRNGIPDYEKPGKKSSAEDVADVLDEAEAKGGQDADSPDDATPE
jgi:hypothetical protein